MIKITKEKKSYLATEKINFNLDLMDQFLYKILLAIEKIRLLDHL